MNDVKLAEGPLPVGEIPEWLRIFADSLDDNRHMSRPLVESEDTTFYIRQSADRIDDLQAVVKALQRDKARLDWLERRMTYVEWDTPEGHWPQDGYFARDKDRDDEFDIRKWADEARANELQ